MTSLVLSAALGWVAGMRSATAPATLARALASRPTAGDRWLRRPDGWPATWLAARPAPTALALAAAGELVADKLPMTPHRTDAAPFAGRVASGALVGAAVAGRRGTSLVGAALAGAVGAAVSTVAMHRVRAVASDQIGALPAALAEDALALALGTAASRAVVRT